MSRTPPHDFHAVYTVQETYRRLMDRIAYEVSPLDKKHRVMSGAGEVLHIAATDEEARRFGDEWQAQFDGIAAAIDEWFGPAFRKAAGLE